jgi:hypothetical protein
VKARGATGVGVSLGSGGRLGGWGEKMCGNKMTAHSLSPRNVVGPPPPSPSSLCVGSSSLT